MRDASRSSPAQEIAIISQSAISGRQGRPADTERLRQLALAWEPDAQSHTAVHDQQLQRPCE
jgi:hypothetical protein